MRGSSTGLTLNFKVSLFGAVIVLIAVTALVLLAVWQSGRYNDLAQSEVDGLINADLDHIAQGIYNLVQTENEAVQQQVDSALNLAQHLLAGAGPVSFAAQPVSWEAVNQLTGERTTIRLPRMLVGGRWLGNNQDPVVETPVVDEVSRLIGESVTIFQRMNPRGDMLRVATTVRAAEGLRAVGTYIPALNPDGTANPVVESVMRGETYSGRAYVVNAYSLTAYHAIRDAGGAVVGMLYVGVRLASIETRVRQAILRTRVGRTGYVYVLGGTGEERGRYIISQRGERDGENIWEDMDSDGRPVVQEIIRKAVALKPGELATEHYRWQNPGETVPRWKVVRLAYFQPWDWVIGASVYEDELQGYRAILSEGRRRMTVFMAVAGFAVTALMWLLGAFVAWSIVGPVRRLTAATETIIGGNLDGTVHVRSRDEIGVLARTFNTMTERLKRMMEDLQRSEEKYRGIFENAIEGFFQSSLEGRFLTANPAMADVLGYDSPADLVESVTDIQRQLYVRAEDRNEVIASLLEQGTVIGREVQFRRKDGEVIWVSLHDRLVRDGNGKPLYIEGFIYDITTRMRADEATREANERFRSVLRASVAYAIIVTDPDGLIKVFNEGAELMLGYGPEEVVDRATPELFHEHGSADATGAMSGKDFAGLAATAQGGGQVTREQTYVRKDGSRLTVSLGVTALHSEDGRLSGFIVIARDITVERRLEGQLLQSRKMESVGLLAGGVAHDFNNMLTPILGYTELLASDFTAGDSRLEQLEIIKNAAERARNLTQRLLAFSRKQLIELKTVDLGDVIRRFQDMLHQTIREDIRIAISIPPSLSAVRADAGQIEQVLLNLSFNAQDAMPGGGTLAIELADIDLDESYAALHPETVPGPYVMLSISDTGTGMDARALEHVFEPFFTTKELGKGTGLGLSTVYGIVKQHGGSINVYTEKDHGTTFKIFLPRAAPRGAAVERRPDSPTKLLGGGETILVAEDNEMVRTLACAMLGNLGYRVLAAETSERCIALAQANGEHIDLLLTDVIMPKINGRDLYDVLRRGRPDLKVLFMSGYSSDVIGHHGVLDEGMQFIQKPLTLYALSVKIRQVLDSRT